METKKIISDLDNSTGLVLEKVNGLSFEEFNYKPSKKEWSVGEVIEHLDKLETSITRVFEGQTKDAGRKPDAKIEDIMQVLLDTEARLTAGNFISPKAGNKEPLKIVREFTDNRNELKDLIQEEDMRVLCLGFKHAMFGEMTRFEWIYFLIYHSQRHLAQIDRIIQSIPANKEE